MSKFKKILLSLLMFLAVAHLSYGQFREQKGLRFALISYAYNNSTLPGNNGESHISFTMDVVKKTYNPGDIQFTYRAPIIGDATPEVIKLIKGESAETVGETFLTSLFPGWIQMGYNVYATDNLVISPGFFVGDYWYTAFADNQLFSVSAFQGIIEPSGWYGAAGPSVFIDYVPIKAFPVALHLETSYNVSMRWKESGKLKEYNNFDPESPDPHFLNTRLELQLGFFYLGYRWVKMINRFEGTASFNSGSRSDIILGISF